MTESLLVTMLYCERLTLFGNVEFHTLPFFNIIEAFIRVIVMSGYIFECI